MSSGVLQSDDFGQILISENLFEKQKKIGTPHTVLKQLFHATQYWKHIVEYYNNFCFPIKFEY